MSNDYKYLKDVNPKISYSKFIDKEINAQFYNPCLSVSIEYYRAVGFFSSSIYTLIYKGIDSFIKNGGKSKILCSYKLDPKDLKSIHEGYEKRSINFIKDQLNIEFDNIIEDGKTIDGLKILSSLIEYEILDVKIALIDDDSDELIKKMFHDKLGIFTDSQKDSVVFHGSNNETYLGLADDGNYESFNVFVSWDDGRDGQRCTMYKDNFDQMWNNTFKGIKVYDIPSEFSKRLSEIAVTNHSEFLKLLGKYINPKKIKNPKRIEDIDLWDHQTKALDLWKENNHIGILKHATGSGKTITGIIGLYRLKNDYEDFIGTVILVPGDLLLKQWRKELLEKLGKENVDLILCGGGNNEWKKGAFIKRAFSKSKKHKIILSTYDTASSDKFLQIVSSIKNGDLLLIADEVHRIGSPKKQKIMDEFSPKYKLGLSATPVRENDDKGTNLIISYFAKILHEYNLSDAIKDDHLTKYFYYVQLTSLTEMEEENWNKLSKEISKDYARYMSGGQKDNSLTESIKKKTMRRARIIKGAQNKIQKAVDLIENNLRSNQKWLVYCDKGEQINELRKALKEKGIDAIEYIYDMKSDKIETMKYYTQQDSILLSIKCLDEGVNIPTVTHALIIASSQTEREYIQRRGRVLRLSYNKNFSRIFDILVLPTHNENDISNIALSEIKRSLDFSKDSENPDERFALERMLIKKNIDPKTLISEGFEDD